MRMLVWQNGGMGKMLNSTKFTRTAGLRSLSDLAAKLGGTALRRHGFAQDKLITQWNQLVGPQFSEVSLPIKLSFPPNQKRGGTLTVKIEGSLATQFQHIQDVVLERINAFFGYKAVDRIRLVQGEIPRRDDRRRLPSTPAGPPPKEVAGLADGPLKDALIQLAATFSVDKPA
jgi:hypothetical protein